MLLIVNILAQKIPYVNGIFVNIFKILLNFFYNFDKIYLLIETPCSADFIANSL